METPGETKEKSKKTMLPEDLVEVSPLGVIKAGRKVSFAADGFFPRKLFASPELPSAPTSKALPLSPGEVKEAAFTIKEEKGLPVSLKGFWKFEGKTKIFLEDYKRGLIKFNGVAYNKKCLQSDEDLLSGLASTMGMTKAQFVRFSRLLTQQQIKSVADKLTVSDEDQGLLYLLKPTDYPINVTYDADKLKEDAADDKEKGPVLVNIHLKAFRLVTLMLSTGQTFEEEVRGSVDWQCSYTFTEESDNYSFGHISFTSQFEKLFNPPPAPKKVLSDLFKTWVFHAEEVEEGKKAEMIAPTFLMQQFKTYIYILMEHRYGVSSGDSFKILKEGLEKEKDIYGFIKNLKEFDDFPVQMSIEIIRSISIVEGMLPSIASPGLLRHQRSNSVPSVIDSISKRLSFFTKLVLPGATPAPLKRERSQSVSYVSPISEREPEHFSSRDPLQASPW